jgi:hypothetical protein
MRKVSTLLAVAVILAILPAAALGQSGITWDTEIVIMNLGTDVAYVTVYYYDHEDGTGTGGLNDSEDKTIAAGGSIKFTPAVASGFNGSAVVESTEPIAVIVNEMGDPGTYTYNASYMGFDAGSGEVRLPALMSCNSGYYTFFNVQNAGSEATTVTVDYIDWQKPSDFTPANETVDLDPGEAHTFTQEPGSAIGQFPSRSDCYTSAYRWIGGAKITSTGGVPVVATANQVHADAAWGMSSYSGFTGVGSSSAVLPAIMYENSPDPDGDRYWSGIAVANVGDATTTVTYSFFPADGAAVSDITVELTVDELDFLLMGEQRTFDAGLVDGEKWLGTVVVDGGGENIMVMTNQLSNKRGELSAWKGIDPATASDTIQLPLILSDNLPGEIWWSGFMVYNLDPSSQATVTVEYTECGPPYCATAWTPSNEVWTLDPETSYWWLQSGDWTWQGWNDWSGKYYFGNATVTSNAGQPIVAIVSLLGSSQQDNGELTNSYNGLNR